MVAAVHPAPGGVHPEPGLHKALRDGLVDGGHAQSGADVVAVDHLQGEAEGPAQQPVGQGQVPLFNGPADPGGAHLLPLFLHRGDHLQEQALLQAQLLEQGHVAPGVFPKAEVLSAAQELGPAALRKHLPDKVLRLPVLHLREIQPVQPPDPRGVKQLLLVLGGGHRRSPPGALPEGEHPGLPGGRHRRPDHRHVAPVQAVEGPQGQGAGSGLPDLFQLFHDLHTCSSGSQKSLRKTISPRGRSTAPRPRKTCPGANTRTSCPWGRAMRGRRSRSIERLPPF